MKDSYLISQLHQSTCTTGHQSTLRSVINCKKDKTTIELSFKITEKFKPSEIDEARRLLKRLGDICPSLQTVIDGC